MTVEFKDYYATLGVPETASQDEIHRAFRSLARQHHPDVSKSKKGSDEKFKEINEANEVLGDPGKRRKYDALRERWQPGQPFEPQGGAPGPGWAGAGPGMDEDMHFSGTGFSDFFEKIFGMRGGQAGWRPMEDSAEEEPSPARGRDVEADILVTLPEALRGSKREVTLRRATPCSRCQGAGQAGGRLCPACGGRGTAMKTEVYAVTIPPGVHEGQRLRLGGQGERGQGRPGDLFLRVVFANPADYRIEHSDLVYDLQVSPWDAVLGAKVTVPLLEGQAALTVPAGTVNGCRFRLRGQGAPKRGGGRGDLFVMVHIAMPEQVSERARALWRQLRDEARGPASGR